MAGFRGERSALWPLPRVVRFLARLRLSDALQRLLSPRRRVARVAARRRIEALVTIGRIDIIKVDVDHDGVQLTLYYPHCQRCDWEGEKVRRKDLAQIDGGVHVRMSCLADAEASIG